MLSFGFVVKSFGVVVRAGLADIGIVPLDVDTAAQHGRRSGGRSAQPWLKALRRGIGHRGQGRWDNGRGRRRSGRSAEHTSELQSLMRISYDGFGLKKKYQKLRNR